MKQNAELQFPFTLPLLLLALATAGPLAAQQKSFDDLESFVNTTMKDWQVPGMALAIIKDGKVIHSKGYGFRDIEKKLPVTPQTLFAIGSISKSFTVTAIGMLNDDGKLDWDAPVRTYLPDFHLYDKTATGQMTARDLTTHRSGLPRHDLLWYSTSFDRGELVARLRYLEPNRAFRSTWQYQNLMYVTAGYLAGQIAGTTWENLVRQRILVPLGMARTNLSVNDSAKDDNFSQPYILSNGKVRKIPLYNLDAAGPAGSINSSVEEMALYLIFHINRGLHRDLRLLSQHNALAMQTPQMVLAGTPRYQEVGHESYGMAFFVTTYRGHKLVWHSGSINGFRAWMGFLPGSRDGVVLLSNQGSAGVYFRQSIAYGVFDRLLGLGPVPWSARYQKERANARAARAAARKKDYTLRRRNAARSHPLKDYAGTYSHPAYGDFKVRRENNKLMGTFGDQTFTLGHYHYDIFTIGSGSSPPLRGRRVTFLYNHRGDFDRIAAPLETNVADIVFARQPGEALTRHEALSRYTGRYQLPNDVATVSLRADGALVMTVPGRSVSELRPARRGLFDVLGRPGVTIEFKRNGAGKVTEAVLYDSSGALVAKKLSPGSNNH